MKTSIEIEYKTLISEKEYLDLLKAFELEENVFHQRNYYFDSPDFFLRANNMALRIRQKNGMSKLTLKHPHEDGGLYEDSIILTEEKAQDMIKNGFKPLAFGIDKNVAVKAILDTYRASTIYDEGRIFFDKSEYDGVVDYEVEYEASDLAVGLQVFEDFLKDYNITKREGKHKINRVYDKLGF